MEENDLVDKFSFNKALLDQRDLARSVEKCKEKLNRSYNGSYFSFDVNIRTSTPVETLNLHLRKVTVVGKRRNSCFLSNQSLNQVPTIMRTHRQL